MPLTCSHPAAILTFRRFTPNRLNFAALVIGSMSPDAGYFIGERGLAKLAHHPIGTVKVICIPTGLVLLLGLFYLTRRELCFILPSPHRNQLTPLARQKPVFTLEALLIAIVSILLGACTHIFWDQFTHDGTFVFRHFAPASNHSHSCRPARHHHCLRPPVHQHNRWRSHPCALLFQMASFPTAKIRQRTRFMALLSLVQSGFSCHWPLSAFDGPFISAPPSTNSKPSREFVYKMGVISVSIFTILIVISAILAAAANCCFYPRNPYAQELIKLYGKT